MRRSLRGWLGYSRPFTGHCGIGLNPRQQCLLRHSDAAPARNPHYRQDAGSHPTISERSADIQRLRDFCAPQ
jgi:hypothetical protein